LKSPYYDARPEKHQISYWFTKLNNTKFDVLMIQQTSFRVKDQDVVNKVSNMMTWRPWICW